jgi:hypothetical protein
VSPRGSEGAGDRLVLARLRAQLLAGLVADTVTIEPFDRLATAEIEALEADAAALGRYLSRSGSSTSIKVKPS